MNYMWNDIYTCYVKRYMPTMLSSSHRHFFMVVLYIPIQMYLSVHKLLQQYTKYFIDSMENQNISISRYRYQNHACNHL